MVSRLPGPPLTNDTTLAVLFREGVKVGLKCREAQDVRNMRFDLTWVRLKVQLEVGI